MYIKLNYFSVFFLISLHYIKKIKAILKFESKNLYVWFIVYTYLFYLNEIVQLVSKREIVNCRIRLKYSRNDRKRTIFVCVQYAMQIAVQLWANFLVIALALTFVFEYCDVITKIAILLWAYISLVGDRERERERERE